MARKRNAEGVEETDATEAAHPDAVSSEHNVRDTFETSTTLGGFATEDAVVPAHERDGADPAKTSEEIESEAKDGGPQFVHRDPVRAASYEQLRAHHAHKAKEGEAPRLRQRK